MSECGGPRRVVILDDEEVVYEMLCDFFEERGYEVVGQDAFLADCPALGGGNPGHDCPCADVIVSDHHLGEITGLDIFESIVGGPCDIRHKAIISGAFMPRDETRARELGCRIFRKPFSLVEVEDWLDRIEAERIS
jgi:CheY-like chemotaxis protein